MNLLRLLKKTSFILVIALVISIILPALFLSGTANGGPEAQTRDATNITATSATLNGEILYVGSIIYKFEYGLTTAYGDETSSNMDSGPFLFHTDISGLSPGTTYHFRVTVSTDGSTWTPYNDKSFTTTGGSSSASPSNDRYRPPTVITISSSNITDSSAIITGNLTSLGTAKNYTHPSLQVRVYFKYGTQYYQTIVPVWAGGKVTPPQIQTALGEFIANLTNLDPGTTYYFRAVAKGDGTFFGKVQTFTTSFPAQK